MVISAFFGEKFFNYDSLTLKVVGNFSRGIYLSDGESIFLIYSAEYGKLYFGVAVNNFDKIKEMIKDDSIFTYKDNSLHVNNLLIKHDENFLFVSKISKEFISLNRLLKNDTKSVINQYYNNSLEDKFQFAHLDKYLPSFIDSLTKMDEKECDHNLAHLIGFGKGLTPDFDDYLMGLLSVLREENKEMFSMLSKLTLKHIENTSLISKEYLTCFIESKPCEVVDYAVNKNNSFYLNRLLSLGHSSGFSIASGIVKGKEICYGQI